MPYLRGGGRVGGVGPRRSRRSIAGGRAATRQVRRRPGETRQVVRGQRPGGRSPQDPPGSKPQRSVQAVRAGAARRGRPAEAARRRAGEGRRLECEALEAARRICTDVLRDGAAGGPLRSGGAGFHAGARRNPGESRLRARPAIVGLPEVPGAMAHVLRGEETTRRFRLEQEIRLAAESQRAPLRTGRALLRRPLDFGRRRRETTQRHPLGLEDRDRALSDPHGLRHRGRRGAWGEARTAQPALAAALHPLLRLGGGRGDVVRRPVQAAARLCRFGTRSSTSATATTTAAR